MLLLPALLTHAEVPDTLALFRRTLDQGGAEASGPAPLVVDASALTQFDSSALAVLLECRRMAKARGRAFEARGLPPKLATLAGLYGVAGLLGLA